MLPKPATTFTESIILDQNDTVNQGFTAQTGANMQAGELNGTFNQVAGYRSNNAGMLGGVFNQADQREFSQGMQNLQTQGAAFNQISQNIQGYGQNIQNNGQYRQPVSYANNLNGFGQIAPPVYNRGGVSYSYPNSEGTTYKTGQGVARSDNIYTRDPFSNRTTFSQPMSVAGHIYSTAQQQSLPQTTIYSTGANTVPSTAVYQKQTTFPLSTPFTQTYVGNTYGHLPSNHQAFAQTTWNRRF